MLLEVNLADATQRILDAHPEFLVSAQSAVRHVLCTCPEWEHERDDLVGEANLALAVVLDKMACGISYQNPKGYIYAAAKNRIWNYIYPLRASTPVDELPARTDESADRCERAEVVEELLACCSDDFDVAIVRGREAEQTMVEIAEALSLNKSTVSRRLDAIQAKFTARNS